MKARGQLSVSSITRTACSLASFTIWRRLNIKNISTIILGARVGRTPTSRWRSAIEISIARRVLAQIFKKCSTTTAIANLPGPRRTLSRKWRSLRRIMPQRFRSSTVLLENQRNRRWPFPHIISKRAASRLWVARKRPPIYTSRLQRLEIRILIARMHESQQHPFSQAEEERSMR